MITNGEQLIQKGDIYCIFNFKTKEYKEYPLDCCKSQVVTSTKTGKEYTSHFNMAVSEFMDYDTAVTNSTVRWEDSSVLWFYKEGDKTYLAALQSNVFQKPYLPAGKYTITILRKDKSYTDLKKVFDLYLANNLGIDAGGNLVPYIRGITKKFNYKHLTHKP